MKTSMIYFAAGAIAGSVGATVLQSSTLEHPPAAASRAGQPVQATRLETAAAQRTEPSVENYAPQERTAAADEPGKPNNGTNAGEPTAAQVALFHALQQRMHNTAYNHDVSLTELVNEGTALTPQQQQELRNEAITMIQRGELSEAQFITGSQARPDGDSLPTIPATPTEAQIGLYNHMQARIHEAVQNRSTSLSDLLQHSGQLTVEQRRELTEMVNGMISRGELSERQFAGTDPAR